MMLAVFSARLTSTLAVKEVIPVVNSLEDVHELKMNLYIKGEKESSGMSISTWYIAPHELRRWKHRESVQERPERHHQELDLGRPDGQGREISRSGHPGLQGLHPRPRRRHVHHHLQNADAHVAPPGNLQCKN